MLPAFQLQRKQYCCATNDCLAHLEELMEDNRNFCFYWYPRRDDVSLRLWNPVNRGTTALPYAKLYKEMSGWSKDILPSEQQLKFNETECSFETDAAISCFKEIRKRVLKNFRRDVAWRILFRPVAADENFLSNAEGRQTVAITVHQHAQLP